MSYYHMSRHILYGNVVKEICVEVLGNDRYQAICPARQNQLPDFR
jgi:hypothetical protein